MKLIMFIALFSTFSIIVLGGDTIKKETFTVYGNCGMCKSRIEKSLKISEVSSAQWDKNTKILSVKYNANAITLDSLQKIVASVGHDTEKYKAADEVYNDLPGCCLYRENKESH
ncbi:MAG: heavy-metal-associated domain-containing protein [Bacteroidota bacterium]|nr:heavy-metal-associated domain-containing protein [Bacteroidota bacterium]